MNFFKKKLFGGKEKQAQPPDFVSEYFSKCIHQKVMLRELAENIRFVILDTETTGLDTKKDFVLSIGAIAVENSAIKVQDSLELVLKNDGVLLEAETVEVHGLTLKDLENGKEHMEAVSLFLRYLEDAVIVAHHAAFDVKMLNKTIATAIQQPFQLKNHVIDTANLAKRVDYSENPYEIRHSYRLDELCKRYGIALHDRHTAWGDALITAKLFLMLTRQLEKRGNKTLKDFMRKKM